MRSQLMLLLLAGASVAVATEESLPFPVAVPLAAPALPGGSSGTPAVWNVQPGETLYGIARRYGISLAELLALNPAVDARRPLMVGRALVVPTAVPGPVPPPAAPIPMATGISSPVAAPMASRAALSGPWVLPVSGARLTSTFSPQHLGLDLAASAGTPVLAAAAGVVTESRLDTRTGWGWTVVVDHGNGLRTRYSHNSENIAQVGDQVEAGQVIARVGSTGNSTGSHLDYRVLVAGTPVNPLELPHVPPGQFAAR
ncbi:peptidoglycan DD-metalloendopeptidase family protein [Deinococcus sp. DB0503]|uniref:peptidoglycan DD-metalloendopeptidase family protein n=1 Tax=Deinococcus sp. DB0503 TaxID=2479203 RepID=UPI0018DF2DFC|nr:M23 family metallopeptidase [Deinococcus sp. DB0503]MBI0445512.1 LysM peptidoglycan-binding domain-containing protein [Deinococcus sp. DB0503]